MPKIAIALAALALAGCGGGGAVRAVSFELPMPHASSQLETTIALPGDAVDVYVGATAIATEGPTCIDHELAISYRREPKAVLVYVDDAAVGCAGATKLETVVGGYGSLGGYVGEWLPVAVTYR